VAVLWLVGTRVRGSSGCMVSGGGGARVCNRKVWQLRNGVWLVASSIYRPGRPVVQGPVDELVPGRSVRLTHVWGSTGMHVDLREVDVRRGLRRVGWRSAYV
jgi:hypothetical protein